MNKINYFMEKDTRLVNYNLTKIIINKDLLLIQYTILRKDFKDKKIIVVRYLKSKNRLFIYEELKDYNPSIYEGFIEWAEANGIERYIVGKIGNENERNN